MKRKIACISRLSEQLEDAEASDEEQYRLYGARIKELSHEILQEL